MDAACGEAGVTRLACGLADTHDPVRTPPGRQLRPAERERSARHPARVAPLVAELEGALQMVNSLLRVHIADEVVEPTWRWHSERRSASACASASFIASRRYGIAAAESCRRT